MSIVRKRIVILANPGVDHTDIDVLVFSGRSPRSMDAAAESGQLPPFTAFFEAPENDVIFAFELLAGCAETSHLFVKYTTMPSLRQLTEVLRPPSGSCLPRTGSPP
jgi:hypothetical protein